MAEVIALIKCRRSFGAKYFMPWFTVTDNLTGPCRADAGNIHGANKNQPVWPEFAIEQAGKALVAGEQTGD